MPRNRFSEQVRAPEGPATGLAEARRAGGASQVVLKRATIRSGTATR